MSDNSDTEDELDLYKSVFKKLRPFIVLAIDEYYVGDDKAEIESKLEELGYNLP